MYYYVRGAECECLVLPVFFLNFFFLERTALQTGRETEKSICWFTSQMAARPEVGPNKVRSRKLLAGFAYKCRGQSLQTIFCYFPRDSSRETDGSGTTE